MKAASELKRSVLPSSRWQSEQTYIDHLNPRITIIITIITYYLLLTFFNLPRPATAATATATTTATA